EPFPKAMLQKSIMVFNEQTRDINASRPGFVSDNRGIQLVTIIGAFWKNRFLSSLIEVVQTPQCGKHEFLNFNPTCNET
ncbi:hypothetical protein N9Z70_07070, partial [Mariniblastus sp.]|nr:hypothetical protein [Mariniblastus sp.]